MGATGQCNAQQLANTKLPAVAITGYRVLPSNKLEPLMQGLVETGAPIAVSADATSWSFYFGGILSDGKGAFTVNHAILLTAYQKPTPGVKNSGYWQIKNSWGQMGGEQGFIRIEFKENEEEHCGWDMDTHIGLACDGDPDKAWVCGTFGVLYDSVYPTGVHVRDA